MRVLVCGGRNFSDRARLDRALSALHAKYGISTIIHGAARGADTMAGEWALDNAVAVEVFPADWDRYGKAAGLIRNQQMLDEASPCVVVAFPGGRGTQHMVNIATAAGVLIWRLN